MEQQYKYLRLCGIFGIISVFSAIGFNAVIGIYLLRGFEF